MAHVCCLLVRPEVLDTWTAHNDTALTPTTRHWLQSVLLEGGISATSVHELIANSGNAKETTQAASTLPLMLYGASNILLYKLVRIRRSRSLRVPT